MTFSSTPLWRSCTLRRARGHSCGKLAYRLCFTCFRVVHGALHGSAASYLAAFKRSCQVSKMRHFPAHFRRRCLSPFRLPSRSTSCVLGLFSVVICVTGSIVPHARKEVTNWEDHSPHSRDVQHTDGEDSAMPLASFQKEARGVLVEGTKAADPELYHRHGSSPRAEQDLVAMHACEVGYRSPSCSCALPACERPWQPNQLRIDVPVLAHPLASSSMDKTSEGFFVEFTAPVSLFSCLPGTSSYSTGCSLSVLCGWLCLGFVGACSVFSFLFSVATWLVTLFSLD